MTTHEERQKVYADATIMLEQLRYIFNVGPAVDQMVDRKIARLVQRIHDAKE